MTEQQFVENIPGVGYLWGLYTGFKIFILLGVRGDGEFLFIA